MTRILIIGAGGHAQVVADALLCRQRILAEPLHLLGFVDDFPQLWGQTRLGLPILGGLDTVPQFACDTLIVAIGSNPVRQQLVGRFGAMGYSFATAVHPTAVIADGVTLGEGCMVCARVVVNTGSTIGRHTILNTAATLDHHNHIGDFVHIAPGVHTGGEVQVGHGTLVGIGAIIMPQCHVGQNCRVGAGALIHRHLADNLTAVGLPAQPR